MITARELHAILSEKLDQGARVRVKGPNGLYQVELPAHAAEGDVLPLTCAPDRTVTTLSLSPTSGRRTCVLATRAGSLRSSKRSSPGLRATKASRSRVASCAAEVPRHDLLAASLGLLQVGAQAERLAVKTRPRSLQAASFRDVVRALLTELFGTNAVAEGYSDHEEDPEALYATDAFITTKKPLAVAFVPGDLDAERAIGTKMKMKTHVPEGTRWVAIPKDLESLTSKTRKRLVKEYAAAGSSFEEDRALVGERLVDLAA
ncbi:MAG: hypothetical protein JWP97_6212 [Labilithrix sp.]|nr:hypothetical protein [Labilithrix sp.]